MRTERKPSRRPTGKVGIIDPSIYLRTYDVINSLDQARTTRWWQKAFSGIRLRSIGGSATARPIAQLMAPIQDRVALPFRERLALPPAGDITPPQALQRNETEPSPVVKSAPVITIPSSVAVPPAEEIRTYDTTVPIFQVQQRRPISWVLLAVVAAITAGLTFALIHFTWASSGVGDERPRHAATYITTRSVSGHHLSIS